MNWRENDKRLTSVNWKNDVSFELGEKDVSKTNSWKANEKEI